MAGLPEWRCSCEGGEGLKSSGGHARHACLTGESAGAKEKAPSMGATCVWSQSIPIDAAMEQSCSCRVLRSAMCRMAEGLGVMLLKASPPCVCGAGYPAPPYNQKIDPAATPPAGRPMT